MLLHTSYIVYFLHYSIKRPPIKRIYLKMYRKRKWSDVSRSQLPFLLVFSCSFRITRALLLLTALRSFYVLKGMVFTLRVLSDKLSDTDISMAGELSSTENSSACPCSRYELAWACCQLADECHLDCSTVLVRSAFESSFRFCPETLFSINLVSVFKFSVNWARVDCLTHSSIQMEPK